MKIRHRAIPRNAPALPLFAWAEREYLRHLPLAVRRIHCRFGLSAAVSLITAELSGYPTEGER